MAAEHTPGPWSYSHPAQHIWKIRDAGSSLLADYHGANSDENPQNEANARLIAAAPDLLAACEAAHELLWHYDIARQANGVDWGPVDMLRQELIDKLEHAWRKARGAE